MSALGAAGLRAAGARAAGASGKKAAASRATAGKAVPVAERRAMNLEEGLQDKLDAVKYPAPKHTIDEAHKREWMDANVPSGQYSGTDGFDAPEYPGALSQEQMNYNQTQPARQALAEKRAEGFKTEVSDAQSEVDALREERKTQGKAAQSFKEQAAADKTSATELGLVGVQSQQQSVAQRAAEDRQRREEDYERAREGASTGGAQSTTG
jgi:hypothetical protein